MLSSIASGQASGPLLAMLNETAAQLYVEREQLKAEQRMLMGRLQPIENSVDVAAFSAMLGQFTEAVKFAEPQEMQRMLRLMVRRVEWSSEGKNQVEYYCPPPKKWARDWFQTNIRSDGPDRSSCEPLILQVCRRITGQILPGSVSIIRLMPQL